MSGRGASPVLLGFFIMGMVDVVGIATNYARIDLRLRDSVANLLPLTVFIWFALLSVPTGLLMNRLGRRNTVLIGMGITFIALLIPLLAYRYVVLLTAFAMIGIGNTLLQVALNPLLSDVTPAARLTSALTLGQLIKAVASFMGPVVAAWAVGMWGSWKGLLPVFAAVTAVAGVWLGMTAVEGGRGTTVVVGERETAADAGRPSATVMDCLRLLKDKKILALFLGVVAIVGLDVGLNTTLPRFLMERLNLPLAKAGLGTSLYFIARTAGSFAGVFLLAKWTSARVFRVSAALAVGALGLLAGPALFAGRTVLAGQTVLWPVLVLIVVLGLAVANIFPILFAAALRRAPAQANEISGLMIMGVSGGAVLMPLMGLIAEYFGQAGALLFLLVTPLYLYSLKL
jgi:MFS transporter, FHS family, L-fucose permease